uniref:TAF6 C-terminal HEAT repeat domain-containing protein n=1 Tax=Chromera velia CCMP2878 TaxID=1169474 RepID=A0A0G4I5Z9_9ALVE|eukprot:Cvel_11266.t1-p1 / transcript=Cvel_11266.t1 / gene=Cvel_11266 / organism=Chromera_velia_CCMP2878 / gene_product=hypothetical protein / transcript_product=hypothetical protein / location=Cvel_scaffold702:56338-61202(-) / protein_length=609 / sequence_SO=supercontig / SO=protein_coding / is_pseudo=false
MLGGMKGDGVESGVARPSGDSLSYVRLLLSMLEAIIKNSYVSCAARLHQILGALLMFCVGPAARSGDVGMRASSLGPGTNESLAIRRRAAGLLGHICAQATGFGTSIPTTVPSLVAAVFQRNLGPATAVQDPHAFVGALEGLSALGSHLLRRCFWPVLPGVVTALQAEAAREERERPKGWGGGRGLQSVLLPDMHPKSEGGGVETFPVRYTQMSRDNPFQINPGPSASSGLQEWTSVLEEVELNKRQHPDKELERSFLGFHLLRFARAAVEGLRDELVTTSLQRTDVAALGALGSFYGAASVPFLLPLSLSSDGSGRREERWGQGQGGGGGIDRGDRYRRMREAAGRWRKRQKGLRTNEEDIFGLSGAEETEGGGGSSSFLSFRDSETEVDTDSLCGVCGFLGRTLTGVALLPERGDSVSVVGGGEGESEGGVVKGGWKKEEVQGLGLEPNGRMKTNMNCVVADRGVVDDFFGSESEDEEEKDDFDFDSSQQNRPDGVVPSAFGSSALPPPTGGAMSQEELRRRREERDARQQELRDAPFLNELKSVDCILTKIREGKGISVDPNLSRQIHKFSKHRKHTQGGVEQGLKETGSRGNGRGQPGDFLCHTL